MMELISTDYCNNDCVIQFSGHHAKCRLVQRVELVAIRQGVVQMMFRDKIHGNQCM